MTSSDEDDDVHEDKDEHKKEEEDTVLEEGDVGRYDGEEDGDVDQGDDHDTEVMSM